LNAATTNFAPSRRLQTRVAGVWKCIASTWCSQHLLLGPLLVLLQAACPADQSNRLNRVNIRYQSTVEIMLQLQLGSFSLGLYPFQA
jgi:hypothetical protein